MVKADNLELILNLQITLGGGGGGALCLWKRICYGESWQSGTDPKLTNYTGGEGGGGALCLC